jgi:hypothetical protein
MRPLTDERGAIALFIAFALVALMGFGAVVIDVGAMYQERRVLQNGADSAALAIAQDCASSGCGDYAATAEELADANADDDDSDVFEVCGTAVVIVCVDPPPDIPDIAKFVRVTTTTRDAASGGTKVLFGLGRIFGQDGKSVSAKATVASGPPSPNGMSSPPLIFSMCEFYEAVGSAEQAALLPFYPDDDPTTGPFHTIYFHTTAEAGSCPAGPSGYDLPGGFGWLDSDGCVSETYQVYNAETQEYETWVDDKTGVAVPNDCEPDDWHDGSSSVVLTLPFFDETNELSGSNGSYRIVGYASIYVTGFKFPNGAKWPSGYTCPEGNGSSSNCVSGYFVRTAIDGTEFGTVDLGTRIIKVIE